MSRHALIDAGPLVSYLTEEETVHAWAVAVFESHHPPLLTTEPVVTEAIYLMRRGGSRPDLLLEMILRGAIAIPFVLSEEVAGIRALMKRYANVPMSLADASLVLMSEEYGDCTLLTLDSDFKVYRRFRNDQYRC